MSNFLTSVQSLYPNGKGWTIFYFWNAGSRSFHITPWPKYFISYVYPGKEKSFFFSLKSGGPGSCI